MFRTGGPIQAIKTSVMNAKIRSTKGHLEGHPATVLPKPCQENKPRCVQPRNVRFVLNVGGCRLLRRELLQKRPQALNRTQPSAIHVLQAAKCNMARGCSSLLIYGYGALHAPSPPPSNLSAS